MLYNPKKDRHSGPRVITPARADLFFYRQIIMGDRVDNYFGCPNIGEVKSKRIITPDMTESQWWKAIVGAYRKEGLDEAYALNQARCARLLRADDWNKKQRKVKLWKPVKR